MLQCLWTQVFQGRVQEFINMSDSSRHEKPALVELNTFCVSALSPVQVGSAKKSKGRCSYLDIFHLKEMKLFMLTLMMSKIRPGDQNWPRKD